MNTDTIKLTKKQQELQTAITLIEVIELLTWLKASEAFGIFQF